MAETQLETASCSVPLMPCPLVHPSAKRAPKPRMMPPAKATSTLKTVLSPKAEAQSDGTQAFDCKSPEMMADRNDPITTPKTSITANLS